MVHAKTHAAIALLVTPEQIVRSANVRPRKTAPAMVFVTTIPASVIICTQGECAKCMAVSMTAAAMVSVVRVCANAK